MSKSDRQKYNFLAAFVKQFDQARDEGDSLVAELREVMDLDMMDRTYNELLERLREQDERMDAYERRTAELELALEELDDDGSESVGEDALEDDDGDYDDELEGVEPPVGGPRPTDRRLATAVGRTGGGNIHRRDELVDRKKVGRGTKP